MEAGTMDVLGLGFVGTRTAKAAELARFFQEVLRLEVDRAEPDFWVFKLPDGSKAEVFGADTPDKAHFTTGPVVGFVVRDLPAAVDELRQAGVELVGEPGPYWQHFRGPDGNVYELLSP
jgi:catechol 2,3-dioxygenase-like lactoylglutathione lyase family enzyme